MSPNILLDVKMKLTSSKLLNEKQIDNFINLLKRYRYNKIIYPGVVIRELNTDTDTAYEVLSSLVEDGILEANYEIYCHKCHKFRGKIYRSVVSIPKDLCCDGCDSDMNPFDDTIVIFRVINDGDD